MKDERDAFLMWRETKIERRRKKGRGKRRRKGGDSVCGNKVLVVGGSSFNYSLSPVIKLFKFIWKNY